MQDANGLLRPCIDRRSCANEVLTHFQELNAELRDDRVHMDRGKGLDIRVVGLLPDRGHGGSLLSRDWAGRDRGA
jgi:hypothetical protein